MDQTPPPETDLFGDRLGAITMELRRRREWRKPNGYARPPGSGPQGETCKTCAHCCATGANRKTYYKCELLRRVWTNGLGTDILLRSPACSMWKKNES